MTTCKKGTFAGETCSDLSDRALIGAGRTGILLDLKDATLPDHEHRHSHTGSKRYNIDYQKGEDNGDKAGAGWSGGSVARKHKHTKEATTNVTINFADMNQASAPISRIIASKVATSSKENELYSPHMRVQFMFKCY